MEEENLSFMGLHDSCPGSLRAALNRVVPGRCHVFAAWGVMKRSGVFCGTIVCLRQL